MMALRSAVFCPWNGYQTGLLYLAAGWRDTTRHKRDVGTSNPLTNDLLIVHTLVIL
jgi:hypothetical protein